MSSRWPAGIIRKNPIVPAGPDQAGLASGIWSVSEAMYWQKQGLWPIAGYVAPDPYFTQVSLLLSTTALNGAQNNTFLDSSTNNFTITRNGTPTQGSLNPNGTSWSNYFGGASSYFSSASSAVMTGNFTVEFWMYLEDYSTARGIYTAGNETPQRVGFYITTGGRLAWDLYGAGTTTIGTDGSVPLRAWTHVALVKNGTTCTGYINGTAVGSGGMNYTFGNANGFSVLGGWLGYASNFRVVNGTAVYTSNFTPPTTPLTAITNTFLLICQNNRFRDNSTNNFTLTRNGTIQISSFDPFAPSAVYSTTTNGGSMYFTGSGNTLVAASNAAFGFGSGDFTIEFWFYYTSGSFPADDRYISFGATSGCLNLTQKNGIGVVNEAVTHIIENTGVNFDQNAWNHIAFTRSSSTLRLFKNGVQFASASSSAGNSTGAFTLSNIGLTGYYSGVRVVKGTALYTSNFTPPTTPATAVSGTSLLLSGTNAGIFDAAALNDIQTIGNAQVSTSAFKYGGSSMAFDGTGDWVVAPDQPYLNFGAGNFTFEFWINFNSVSGTIGVIGKRTSEANYAPLIMEMSSSALRLYMSTTGSSWQVNGLATATLSTGTWYHIAVSRSGSTVYMFVDGVSVGSTGTASGALMTNTSPLYIGANSGSPSGAGTLNGYIDELRITNGYARYTSNFTPPTQGFPAF